MKEGDAAIPFRISESIVEIRKIPTTLTREQIFDDIGYSDASIDGQPKGWHESLMRSYHIVKKVKALLAQDTAPAVVLELISLMESND